MKKLIKTLLVVVLFSVVLIGFDIHILRGYFLLPYFYQHTFEEFNGNIEYTVSENPNGTWNFFLRNNDFAYYPIIVYRSEMFFDLNDATLFQYAARLKVVDGDSINYDTGGGFDCGTDLTFALIRPFESFKMENVKIEDEILNLGLCSYEMKEQGIDYNTLEDITCRLYLPMFSFGEEKTRVYSNRIKLKSKLFISEFESY